MSQKPDAQRPVETSPLLTGTNGPQPAHMDNGVKATTTSTPARALPKVDTDLSWATPAGLAPRGPNDESLVIFRRALGINSDRASSTDSGTLEEGRRRAVGIYRAVLTEQKNKRIAHHLIATILYVCHFAQIIVGAVLTALGPNAKNYEVTITILGAVNTVIAGVLALLKGNGLPDRLQRDEMGFRKLQDWIEETEALLSVGIIGRNRKEVGVLVEVAFRKYNACYGRSYDMMSTLESDSEDDRPVKRNAK